MYLIRNLFGKRDDKNAADKAVKGRRKMQALKFISVNEFESDEFDHIRNLAQKALSSDDIQDSIKYYRVISRFMSDFIIDRPHGEYINFDAKKMESPNDGIYSLNNIEEVLVNLTNSFPAGLNVELGTWITGSTDDYLDHFTVPRVIGVVGPNSIVKKLTDNINRYVNTLDILALRHTEEGETVPGILLDALHSEKNIESSGHQVASQGERNFVPTKSGNISSAHNHLFIEADDLIVPIGETLSDYLTPQSRKLLQFADDQQVTDEELKERLLTSKNTIKTNIRTLVDNAERWDQYTLLQESNRPGRSFDIDAYGTYMSWHPTNAYYQRVLQRNKFAIEESGKEHGAYMSLHLHNAYTQQEIDLANQRGTALNELLDAVGRDVIHTLPTPSDILHDTEVTNHLKKIGIDTCNVGNLILSLTNEEGNA